MAETKKSTRRSSAEVERRSRADSKAFIEAHKDVFNEIRKKKAAGKK